MNPPLTTAVHREVIGVPSGHWFTSLGAERSDLRDESADPEGQRAAEERDPENVARSSQEGGDEAGQHQRAASPTVKLGEPVRALNVRVRGFATVPNGSAANPSTILPVANMRPRERTDSRAY
jgi:hypothetical protein